MGEDRLACRTVNAQFFSAANTQHTQPAPDQFGDRIEEPQAKGDIQIDQIEKPTIGKLKRKTSPTALRKIGTDETSWIAGI